MSSCATEMTDAKDRFATVPSWDGDPSNWSNYVSEVKWYVSGLRWQDRSLAASRLVAKLLKSSNLSLQQWARDRSPEGYEHAAGCTKLLEDLAASPLGRQPIPDAAGKIKYYYTKLKRRKGETVGQFLVRESTAYDDLTKALDRLAGEMNRTSEETRPRIQTVQCSRPGCAERVSTKHGDGDDYGRFFCRPCWDWWSTKTTGAENESSRIDRSADPTTTLSVVDILMKTLFRGVTGRLI